MTQTSGYDAAVRAWAAHLRAGGTRPWTEFAASIHSSAPVTRSGVLPGAAPLALLQHLAVHAASLPDFDRLADLVLATVPPGRGLVDAPLTWPAGATGAARRFGGPAYAPENLPPREILRVAVGVLAVLVPELRLPRPAERPRWPRPWRGRFQLVGAPMTVSAVRAELLRRGLHETDWRARHVVVARPLALGMAEVWADRVRHGGIVNWHSLWQQSAQTGHLAPSLDAAGLAAQVRASGQRTHVVIPTADSTASDDLWAVDWAATQAATPSTSAVDLVRRLNRLLRVRIGPDSTAQVAEALLGSDLLEPLQPGTQEPLGIPEPQRAWAAGVAAEQARLIAAVDCPVHGDPVALHPDPDEINQRSGVVQVPHTLALATDAIVRVWPAVSETVTATAGRT